MSIRAIILALIVTQLSLFTPMSFGATGSCRRLFLADGLQAVAEQIHSLKMGWADSVMRLDLDAVVAKYSSHATLLPTRSNVVRESPERIRAYFIEFLSLGPKLQFEDESYFHFLGTDHATESGYYVFSFANGLATRARYTFIYEKTEQGWLILKHSSTPAIQE